MLGTTIYYLVIIGLFIWPIKHFVQESLYITSATLSSKSHQNHVVVVIIQVPIQLLIVMLQKFGRAATYSIKQHERRILL